MNLSPQQCQQFHSAVLSAAGRKDVRDAICRVYHELQTRIDARKPLCSASGKCCRFEEYGHSLFISTMEMASFLYRWQTGTWSDEVSESAKRWNGQGCPFQVDRMCGVHLDRPFGCRIFFCDATAEQWQQDHYEYFHLQLKRLHESLEVPYFYVEWRQAIKAVGIGR